MRTPLREYPTRDEWKARQDGLPDRAKTTLREIAERKANERNDSEMQAMRQQAEADEWRAKFEAAVAAALVAAGAEWLAAYRVPDHEAAGLPDFSGTSQVYFALFDPSSVGCWPMALRMVGGSGHAREWLPTAVPWQVYRPSGTLTYREWLTAFVYATSHTTPF